MDFVQKTIIVVDPNIDSKDKILIQDQLTTACKIIREGLRCTRKVSKNSRIGQGSWTGAILLPSAHASCKHKELILQISKSFFPLNRILAHNTTSGSGANFFGNGYQSGMIVIESMRAFSGDHVCETGHEVFLD